jgi:hypothetical protein
MRYPQSPVHLNFAFFGGWIFFSFEAKPLRKTRLPHLNKFGF